MTRMRSSGETTQRFTSLRTRRVPSGIHLFQWVKDVDAYYKEIVDRGANIAKEPINQPYGIREFGLSDVNGVGIVFGQDIEHR